MITIKRIGCERQGTLQEVVTEVNKQVTRYLTEMAAQGFTYVSMNSGVAMSTRDRIDRNETHWVDIVMASSVVEVESLKPQPF